MTSLTSRFGLLLTAALLVPPLYAQSSTTSRVGPSRGAVMVVGGGAMGPELYARFIELAGGPDALIVDVPTAGGDSTYAANWRGTRGLIAAGARNVRVLHTIDRKLADSDSFAAPLARAGGVWFEGGRQWHLVDSYAGTRTERAFHDVLARGGVVGGSSAGASILSSYMLRGARAGNEAIMAPGYEVGFGFLRGVAIDQHVVARERLRDLADSLMPRHPELLGISEDEGTAWVVRGDTAEIIGRNKAFVYGGRDATDPGVPFLTLRPGDRYDLAARRVTHRAASESPLTRSFADSVFAAFAHEGQPMATVLVARGGKVLINASYGVPPQAKYMPTTTVPNFPLAGLSASWNAMAAQLVARDGKLSLDEPAGAGSALTVRELLIRGAMTATDGTQLVELLTKRGGMPYTQLVERRLFTPIGAHKTRTAVTGELESNVDELYRWSLGLDAPQGFARDSVSPVGTSSPVLLDTTLGWRAERFHGLKRLAAYGDMDGTRNAFVRYPDEHAVVIVLTSDPRADARELADRLAERLLVATMQPR
jgi:cyanophycinase